MKYKSIKGHGAYSYFDFEFVFHYAGGVTLILGKDINLKTANGAGKSSLLKILYYGTYGKELNKANKSQIKNRNSTKGLLIETAFEDLGNDFLIQRFEGRPELHEKGKEGLNFFINGELFAGTSKGDGIETVQNIINEKIGISSRLFLSSVLAKQKPKDSDDFFSASDTKKKEILSDILDLNAYEKAFKLVKEDIALVKTRKEKKERTVSENRKQIELLDEQDIEYKEKEASFSEEIQKEIKSIDLKISQERTKWKKTKALIVDVKNPTDIQKDIDDKKQFLIDNEKDISEEKTLSDSLSALKTTLNNNNNLIKKDKNSINSLTKDKKNLAIEPDDVKILDKEFLEKEISSINKEITSIEELKESLNNMKLKEGSLSNDISNLENKVVDNNKKISELENSTSCPTCLRPFDTVDQDHKKHIELKINEYKKENEEYSLSIVSLKEDQKNLLESIKKDSEKAALLPSLKADLKIFEDALKIENEIIVLNNNITQLSSENKDLEDKINSLSLSLEKVIELKQKVEKINTEINSLNLELVNNNNNIKQNKIHKESLDSITKTAENLKEQKTDLEKKPNTYTELLISNSKKKQGITVTINETLNSIAKDDDEQKYLNFWLLGFSPTGIRSFITDDVIELLNRKVQENLIDLTEGSLSIIYKPQSEDGKGGSSNKISTDIFLNGKETVLETISGGEEQSAILSTNLALTEVAESRAGKKINVRFLDEPFDGMDPSRQQAAFRLFNKLAKNKDGFYVISHDESFQNMCSNVIYILKENEISRVVSKEEFNHNVISEDGAGGFDDFDSNPVLINAKSSNLAEKLKAVSKKKKKD